MKYPQLVSTRAVNAISDWLVSRLEQIGVEAPLIYSRLLLSLLHSSVQINDPIEFGNLEKYFSNQKGSKRFPPNDTETIKKFTAIQCLLDAVSTEQEISCIEKLVDELFEKLIDLEKRSNEAEDDINLLHPHQLPKSIKSLDIEDPRKRYYRAFPALSKEMEDSVWLKKRNGNSLTWPSGSSGTSSSNMDALNNTAGVKRKNKRRRYHQGLNKARIGTIRKNSYGGNSSPTWDTDFEGNWEMGTDLIKEFLMSQKNRNRSISESDASNFLYEKNSEKRMKPTKQEAINSVKLSGANEKTRPNMFCATNNLNKNTNKTRMASNNFMRDVNILSNLIADENLPYDELVSFNEFDSLSNMSRQLYQDDIPCTDHKSTALQQQNDFAQFEAKFNSDVEALWNDDKGKNGAQVATTAESLRNKKNIDNFWTNYYNHHYNNGYIDDRTLRSLIKGTVEDKNDFYSLPSNFNKLDSSDERKPIKIDGENDLSSVGVFISDSIWSDNSLAAINNCKDDVCFYGNCWESKKNLQINDPCEGKDLRNAFNIAKWSECSFETPFTPPSTAVHPPANIEVGSARKLFSENYTDPASTAANKGGIASSLQTQHQLSQPVSLPDYYESSLYSFVTENNNNSKKPSNIVPVVVPQIHQALTPSSSHSIASTTTRTVSLANHSKTSGFIEYSIVKSSSSFFQFNQIAKYDRNKNTNQSRATMALGTASNTLSAPGLGDAANTSIPSVTAVNNSSASSSSPLDDDDNLLTSYRTHFRPIKQNYVDGYQFDISGNVDKIEYERSESGNLYLESEKYFEYMRVDTFLSDEDSSTSSSLYSRDDHRPKNATVVRVQGLYPLKFRMKQTDKQCQTEDSPQMSAKPCADQVVATKKRNINEDADFIGNSSEEIDDATDSDCYFHEEASIDLDKWTMAEMGKKCADNNNTHTLWGMCPACTKEDKCVPANRLLKDELSIEADEIMSDLKYMQDLYICSDWENEDDENDTDSEIDALKNDDDDDESGRYGRGDSVDDHDDNMDNEEQEQIFYNITKLISDLLKPENAKSLVNVLNAGAGNKNIFKGMSAEDELVDNGNHGCSLFDCQKNLVWRNVNNNNNEKYVGGLWSNDENIIWKREMKPWGNWPRMSDNKTANFLEKLNWKHSNLADIWKNGTFAGGSELEMKSSASSSENVGRFNTNSISDTILRSSSATKNRIIAFPTASCKEHVENEMAPLNANNRNIRKQTSCNILATDAVDLVSQRRYHKKAGNCCAMASQTTLNRPDRKRRHSASQNIGCSGSCTNDNGRVAFEWCVGSNRELSAKIGDCNKVEIMAKWESDASKLSSMINVEDSLSSSSLSPKTTIITCKYWTTMDTTLASPYFMDKSSHYDGISAMAMNPSSILRHVTVVSRPLTR